MSLHNQEPQKVRCPVCFSSYHAASGKQDGGKYVGNCAQCGFYTTFNSPAASSITFTVNGTQYTVGDEYDPATSLVEYLRTTDISKGTKQLCNEGGCGLCLVTVKLYEPISRVRQAYTVNSCLVRLYMCDEWEITTIEGLGNPRTGLNPIQQRLTRYNGSQCGFCSPGQIMNMYGLLLRNPQPTMEQVEDAYDSTICRCTGYRPILDAMKSFASDAPPTLKGGMIDIEDLDPKMCKKTGKKCEGHCGHKTDFEKSCLSNTGREIQAPLHIVGARAQWLKPSSLQDLHGLLRQYRTANYRLVFGNTGFGVYKDIGPWMYDVLIDIRGVGELFRIGFTPNIVWGANLSLENLVDLFKRSSTNSAMPYSLVFAGHLKNVANNSVRNLGSWAGNLMLKHIHPGFVSDIYAMLETIGAVLLIGDGDESETQYKLEDFLKLDMKGKIIEAVFLPTYSENNNFIRMYRVSQRLQNCDGYVVAGFNFKLDRVNNWTVLELPTLVFQGVKDTLNRAKLTETFLTGKQLGDPQVLKDAVRMMQVEFAPAADDNFKSSLAVSLFYRYVLDVCGDKVSERYRSGGFPLARPVSSGIQSFDTRREEWPLSEPLTVVDADYQVSGLTRFLDDTALSQTELYASFVTSKQGNARIASIDPQAALAMPGVYKFIQASDFPAGGKNDFALYAKSPEEILCSGRVTYAGQPIGIIVADNFDIANTAASMVNVTYTDVQPPIVDIHKAIEQRSFFPNQLDPIISGDADRAILESARSVSGSVETGEQYNFHMEAQISRCVPNDNGGMDVQATTQHIDQTAQTVASVLNIPHSSVTVEVVRLGGGFGAKITRNCLVSGACALAAYVMQRPVRMVLDLHTNMRAIGKRDVWLANYEVGFTEEGKLNGLKIDLYADVGHSDSDSTLSVTIKYIDSCYSCKNWKITRTAVRTNKPTMTYCRAPGSLQCQFIMNTIMEHVAKELNKDPTEVRKVNLYQKGGSTLNGLSLDYCNIGDIVTQLESSADLASRQSQVAAFNQANRWKKRGLSLVPSRYGLVVNFPHFNVFVAIHHGDGTITIEHGGIDMGQGVNTKTIQVCAYELGVPMSLIRVVKTSSSVNVNCRNTGGSSTSELNCLGVIGCCQILKARMEPVRTKMINPTWQQLVERCFNERVDLTAHYYTHPNSENDAHYNIYGAAITEAEVDVLTGQSQIRRVDVLYDCGESMNPEIDIGQLEGAFVMGLGYHLTEKTRYNPENGALITDGTWEYKPPLPKDLPIDFRVSLLRNAPNPLGVLRSKAVGEPPMLMSSSALFAIKHAVQAARAEIGQDASYFPLVSPALVEDVHRSCLVNPAQFSFQD